MTLVPPSAVAAVASSRAADAVLLPGPPSLFLSRDAAGWGWLGAYALPLASAFCLVLLCYRYRTSRRAPGGLRRAARFENFAERVLVLDALFVALGTPVLLMAVLGLWFFPEAMARGLGANHLAPVRFVSTALAFAGVALSAGWLAPASPLRVVTAAGLGFSVGFLPGLEPGQQLAIALFPVLAALWYAFCLPSARPGTGTTIARPLAGWGAAILCALSLAPALALRWGPPDSPLAVSAQLIGDGRGGR